MSRSWKTVNQPDKISWNSSDDPNRPTTAQSYQFTVPLNTPAIGVDEMQLLRATVPNVINTPWPIYQLVFYYYRMDSIFEQPTFANLRAVRIFPQGFDGSQCASPVAGTPMTNLAGGATEVLSILNTASSVNGDNATLNPYWIAGDLTFSWALNTTGGSSSTLLCMKGNIAGKYYSPAGWDDPNVEAVQQGFDASGNAVPQILVPRTNYFGGRTVGVYPQPYAIGYTLNQKLGWGLSGNCPGYWGLSGAIATTFSVYPRFANQYNRSYLANILIQAETVVNLAGTSCVNVYGSFSGMGSYSTNSNNNKNLLATIPMERPLGNTNYTGIGLKCPLYKVPREIYAIDIELRDDNNQPFFIPDNANMNLEITFRYPLTDMKF